MKAPEKVVWVGLYHHRHGVDVAVFEQEVDAEDLIAGYWKEEFEPDREDEYVEVAQCVVIGGNQKRYIEGKRKA